MCESNIRYSLGLSTLFGIDKFIKIFLNISYNLYPTYLLHVGKMIDNDGEFVIFGAVKK